MLKDYSESHLYASFVFLSTDSLLNTTAVIAAAPWR